MNYLNIHRLHITLNKSKLEAKSKFRMEIYNKHHIQKLKMILFLNRVFNHINNNHNNNNSFKQTLHQDNH